MAEQSNKQAEKAGQEIKASVGGLDIIKKHTHTFSGGMDLDTDISLMKADNYRHATNMTLSSYENSAQSVLSSTPGSTERFIIPTINSVLASIQVMLDTSIQKDELNTTPFYNSTSAIGKQSFFICIANYGPYGQIRIFGIALGADGKPLIDTTINSNTTYVPAGKKVAVQIDIWKQSSSSTPISPGWTTTAKYSMAYNKNILYVSTESGTIESFDLTALAQYKKDGYVRAATSTDELVLEPTFLSIRRKDGAFMSGTYQYCYRYYIKGGAQGALSLCSEKIFVMSGGDEWRGEHSPEFRCVVENGEQIFYPTASLSGTSVKMTVELLIPKSDKYVNVDTCFLNIYRIYCQNDKSDPKIELIQDLSIKDLTTKTGFYDLLDKSGVLDRYVIIDTGEAISDVTGLFGSTEDTKIQSVALKAKKIAVKDGSMYVGNIDIAGASNIEGWIDNNVSLKWNTTWYSNNTIDAGLSDMKGMPFGIKGVCYGWPANIYHRTTPNSIEAPYSYVNNGPTLAFGASGEGACDSLGVWSFFDRKYGEPQTYWDQYVVNGTFLCPRTAISNAYYQTGEKYKFGVVFIMKDGSHSNVKCITDVNLSINEYDYLFLWRGKMRGVYPILTLTLNSQHEVVISNGAVQNGIRNVLLAKGITAIKLVRAKRSRENYRTLWTFLPEQVHMGLWPQTCTPYSANYTANEVAGTTGNDWSKAVLFCSIIPDGIHSNEYTGDAAKWYNSIHASATTPDVLALWCQDFPHWCESAGAAEFDLLSLYQNSFELEEVCGLNNVTHWTMGATWVHNAAATAHIGALIYNFKQIHAATSYETEARDRAILRFGSRDNDWYYKYTNFYGVSSIMAGGFFYSYVTSGNSMPIRSWAAVYDAVAEAETLHINNSKKYLSWTTFRSVTRPLKPLEVKYCPQQTQSSGHSGSDQISLDLTKAIGITSFGSKRSFMHVSQPPLDSKARGGRAVKYDSSLDGEPYCVYGNMSSFIGSSTGMSYCEIPGEEQNRTDGQWGWIYQSGFRGPCLVLTFKVNVGWNATDDWAPICTYYTQEHGFDRGGKFKYTSSSFTYKSWKWLASHLWSTPCMTSSASFNSSRWYDYVSGAEALLKYMTETRKCREYSPAKNTLVRLTKPSKASSINDPFISCGNSIAVNWLPNDSKKYDVNIVARFGDTYYGTNLPMTSTAMNGPSLDENNGSLNWACFPSEHRYNPYLNLTWNVISNPPLENKDIWKEQWHAGFQIKSEFTTAYTSTGNYGRRLYETFTECSAETFGALAKSVIVRKDAKYTNRIYVSTDVNTTSSDNLLMFDENAFIELDTKCGELKMLKMYNSQLYFFQEYGFGTISAGDRSLINDSSGKPVSLGVGSKLGGYNYISMQVGCNDESKLFFSSQGIFFINSTNDGLYQYSGQSLSELFAKGNVKGALAANITYTLCGTSDFLWIKFSSGKVLVYNLKYNVFESFLTFNPATMLNINDTFYHTKYASKVSNSANGYVSFYEPYTDQNNIGKFEDNVGSNMQTVTIISNPEQNVNKKFVSGDMQTWSNQSTLGNFIHNLYSNAKTAWTCFAKVELWMSGDTKHVAYNFGPYEYDPLTLDRKVYNFKDNTELRVRKYGNLYKFSFPKYSRELTINTPPPQGGATIAPEETLGTDVDWCGNILQSTWTMPAYASAKPFSVQSISLNYIPITR